MSLQTSARIPDIQKERLVQLVQNNFLKAVGRFAGVNGVFIKAQLWENIAKELNTLGPARSAEQWKTVRFYRHPITQYTNSLLYFTFRLLTA